MGKEELTPSESEWQVMEVLWESGEALSRQFVPAGNLVLGFFLPAGLWIIKEGLGRKGKCGISCGKNSP